MSFFSLAGFLNSFCESAGMNFLAAGFEKGFSSSYFTGSFTTSLAAPIHSTYGYYFSSISFLY